MTDKIKILAQRASFSNDVEIAILSGKAHCTQLVMQETEHGQMTEPTARLSNAAAQELMDQLWSAGLRPSEGSGSAGAMRATERHLEDMRRLVFDTGEITHSGTRKEI